MEISDKMTQSEGDAFKDWRAYSDPAGRFVVRYPPEWTISGEQPDTVRIQEPGRLAEFSIKYSEIDCITAQSNLRARRLNYYLVREFIRQVARHPANALEFRDTISNRRDFRALVPAERGCYELQWTHSERSEGGKLEATLDLMLSTFELLADKK